MSQPLVARRPDKVQRSADFVSQGFRDEIFASGVVVNWSRTTRCPCGEVHVLASVSPVESAALGEARTDCARCRGRGSYVYRTDLINVQVTGASHTDDVATTAGGFAHGAVRFTLLSEHPIRLYDRLAIVGSKGPAEVSVSAANKLVVPYVERRVRRATIEALRFPAVPTTFGLGTPGDPTVLLNTTYAVDYCVAATTGGVIVDDELAENVDFAITADGDIDWALGVARGTAPAVGARYAIRYLCHPSYLVRSLPFAHRAQTQQFKGQIQLSRLNFCADAWPEWLGEDTQP